MNPLDVPCPDCGAPAGTQCHATRRGRRAPVEPHGPRRNRAKTRAGFERIATTQSATRT